jgi:two-component system invasion response regulator UvrY
MSKKPPVAVLKVLIADDHPVVIEGLKRICNDAADMAVVGVAENGLDAIKLCRKTADAGILLLDIAMPDRSGVEVLKQLHKELPKLPVLMLSIHREEQYAIRCLKAGAAGFLNKQTAPAELVNAIRLIVSGRKYISPSLAQDLANQIGVDHEAPLHRDLSDREYQTLIMIASGKTVSDIASELLLSVKTISMYRSRLLAKMKLRHNAELTHYAIKNHLVDE